VSFPGVDGVIRESLSVEEDKMSLNIYTLGQFACIIFSVFVLLLLLKFSQDRTLKKLAIYSIISSTAWQLSHMLTLLVDSYSLAYTITKIGYVGTIFVVLTYGDFLYYAGNGKRLPFLVFLIRLSFLFLPFILFSDYIVDGVWRYDVGFYPKAGILHPVHLIIIALAIIYTWSKMLHNVWIKHQPPGNRTAMIAFSIMFWATFDYLPNYGIEIPILGWFFFLIGFSYTAYHCLFHSFADISIVNDRLERLLRERTAELEMRNEELDAFAHTVAHDLRSPLSVLIGTVETVDSCLADLTAAEQHKFLGMASQAGRKMDNIIEELLRLSSVRQETVDALPLDMTTIVDAAQERLAPLIAELQAKIVPPGVWPVALGHGPWVEEVWVNYLSNALKYGGRPPHIELGAAAQPDGTARFWVADNGAGLAPEDQARLFVPFTRLDQVRAEGHGLGLSIVRRIVDRLGGQVGVESAPGQGSVFFFTLPAGGHFSAARPGQGGTAGDQRVDDQGSQMNQHVKGE
jgi:signal transduction histidine kinase